MKSKIIGIILRPGTADSVQTTSGSTFGKERVEQWARTCDKEVIGIFPVYVGAAEKLAKEYALDPDLAIVLQIVAFANERQANEVVLDKEDCINTQLTDICDKLEKAGITMHECSQGCAAR